MRYSPSCGCCGGAPDPYESCCPGTAPTSGWSVVVSGLSGESSEVDPYNGCNDTVDCSQFNGTYVLDNLNSCGWEVTSTFSTTCGTKTLRTILIINLVGGLKNIEVVGGIDSTGPPAQSIFAGVKNGESTDCNAIDTLSLDMSSGGGIICTPGSITITAI